jgi:hypothetical protein
MTPVDCLLAVVEALLRIHVHYSQGSSPDIASVQCEQVFAAVLTLQCRPVAKDEPVFTSLTRWVTKPWRKPSFGV